MTSIWLLSGQIGSLQATQMAHEATIRNLDQEQSRLKEKISRLEEEREVLLSQSQTANDQHKQQVLKLEQVLFLSFLSLSQKAFLLPLICLLSSVSARGTPGLWEGALQVESALWGGDTSLQGGAGQSIGGARGETPGDERGSPARERGGEETPHHGESSVKVRCWCWIWRMETFWSKKLS